MKRERMLALAAFVVVCVVWGTTYLAIRVAVETIPPLMLTAMRFTVAGLVMLAVAKARGERIPRDGRTLRELAVIGFLMVGLGNLGVVWAEVWVPSGTAALLVATAPFWMAILESMRRGGERVDLQSGIGMLLGFGGVAMLVAPATPSAGFDRHFLLGALAIQVAAIGWQLGSIRGKYHMNHVPPVTLAALQMLFGGLIVGAVSIAIGEPWRASFNTRTMGAFLYLTLFGSILAYSAYVYALAHLRTTRMSIYAYINPLIAVVAGWLILDERLTALSLVAMAVILGGVALVQTAGMRKAAPLAAAVVGAKDAA